MLPVEAKLEVVAREFHAKRVPLARRDWFLHAVTALASHDVERAALSVHSLVNDHVALERIRPRDVVVVRILRTPDHAAGLIFLATYWFEFHLNETVFEVGVVLDANRKGRLTELLQHIRFAWSGIVFFNGPFGHAAAGLRRGPARRRRAGFHI